MSMDVALQRHNQPDPQLWTQQLLALLKALSWRKGPVALSSGGTSHFYLDCKPTLLHAQGAWLMGRLVLNHIQQLRNEGKPVAGVGGLSLGADPMAVATAALSAADPTRPTPPTPVEAFIIRKEPKKHGTQAWLESSGRLLKGAPVLMLEDVVTTGRSTRQAVERAQQSGLTPVAILSLVDRLEGGRSNLEATGLPYTSLFTRDDFQDVLEPLSNPS